MIITLNVNHVNIPIKRQRLSNWKKKKEDSTMQKKSIYVFTYPLNVKTYGLKVKG